MATGKAVGKAEAEKDDGLFVDAVAAATAVAKLRFKQFWRGDSSVRRGHRVLHDGYAPMRNVMCAGGTLTHGRITH